MQKNKIITDADKKLILRSIISSNDCGLPCRQTKRTAHSVHTRPRNGRKLWAESTAMAKGITRDRMALWNLFYGSVFSWRNYLRSAAKMRNTLLTLALPKRLARGPKAGMHQAEQRSTNSH